MNALLIELACSSSEITHMIYGSLTGIFWCVIFFSIAFFFNSKFCRSLLGGFTGFLRKLHFRLCSGRRVSGANFKAGFSRP